VKYVTKWDGRREPFNRRRLHKTLLRLGVSAIVAEEISKKVESQIYDGIKTKEILNIAFGLLRRARKSSSRALPYYLDKLIDARTPARCYIAPFSITNQAKTSN
jgi:hypothetical protein